MPSPPVVPAASLQLSVHLSHLGPADHAHLEYTARPGSPLGGPLSLRALPGMGRCSAAELGEIHLNYLRAGYSRESASHDPAVRFLLDHIAHVHAYGRHRKVVICDHTEVGLNVIRAIEAIAVRVPPFTDIN